MEKKFFGNLVDDSQIDPVFQLVGLLCRFGSHYQAAANAFFGSITWKQMVFLRGIALFKEPPMICDIAEFLGCSSQNANVISGKLQRSGFLATKPDENDGRKSRLYLTEKAEIFLKEQGGSAQTLVQEMFSVLSENEIQVVIGAMKRLEGKLEELQQGLLKQDSEYNI